MKKTLAKPINVAINKNVILYESRGTDCGIGCGAPQGVCPPFNPWRIC